AGRGGRRGRNLSHRRSHLLSWSLISPAIAAAFNTQYRLRRPRRSRIRPRSGATPRGRREACHYFALLPLRCRPPPTGRVTTISRYVPPPHFDGTFPPALLGSSSGMLEVMTWTRW